jgi:lipopolysaccharide/colanic/teichoic acid biosynthesis glycosyltransferase
MQTGPLQKNALKYGYFKVRENAISRADSLQETFLYIGSDIQVFNDLGTIVGEGFKAADMETALEYLQDKAPYRNNLRAILIDLPYAAESMKQLQKIVRHQTNLQGTTVIFNLRRLKEDEKQQILRYHFVDELADFKTEMALIEDKINFISRIKLDIAKSGKNVKVEKTLTNVYRQRFYFKRAMDLVLASLLSVLLLPVFLIIALAVKLESGGPVFYNSYRAGRGYRIFKFYKFRTMKVGADRMINSMLHLNKYNTTLGPVFFKIHNDPRITRVGAFLRSTGLDELPQLLNVLKGDMSIVGNRPLPLYEAATLTTDEWAERFVAPAGITGLWQVKNNRRERLSAEERIQMDIAYARNNNILLDCWIMFTTPSVIVKELPLPESKLAENPLPVSLQHEFSRI